MAGRAKWGVSTLGTSVLALAAAWVVAGCGSDPPSATAASSGGSPPLVATTPGPTTATSNALADQAPALSGERPDEAFPPAGDRSASASASPPPRAIASATMTPIDRELLKLELDMKRVLSSGPSTEGVLRDSRPNPGVLDDRALAGARAVGGGGAVRPLHGGGGGLVGLGDSGPGASSLKINGKAPANAAASDAQSALEKEGCSASRLDSPAQPPSPHALFEATCGARTFLVSFVPAGATFSDKKLMDDYERLGAVSREGGIFLGVRPKDATADKAAAADLLARVTSVAPRGNVAVGGASVSGGTIANASAVVAGMAAGFRRCYMRGLRENPDLKGSLRVVATVGAKGEVTGAEVTPKDSPLAGPVASCVAARVQSAQFAAPDAAPVTLTIPISFFPG